MTARLDDKFNDPSTQKTYIVIEEIFHGAYVILREMDGDHEILLSQEELKKWNLNEED